jgi:tetratricopeptide (TPR) repeat protein
MKNSIAISSLIALSCATACFAQTGAPERDGTIPLSARKELQAQSDFFNEAEILYRARQYTESRELYRKAFEKDGSFADAYAGIIDCELALGNRVEALKLYDEFFRPRNVPTENKPSFHYSSVGFAVRRGTEYVRLLLDTRQTGKAREILNLVKSQWLRNQKSTLLNNSIPFDDKELPTTATPKDILLQVELMQGTVSLFHEDAAAIYGEPLAVTRLEAAHKLAPQSALASYLLAQCYWQKPDKMDQAVELLLSSFNQEKELRPLITRWLKQDLSRTRGRTDAQITTLREKLQKALK